MQERHRLSIMKIAATAAMLLLVYPAILILRVQLFRDSGGIASHTAALSLVALAWIVAIYGSKAFAVFAKKVAARPAAEFLLDERANPEFISRILIYATLVVPIILAAVLFSSYGVLRVVFEAIAALILYIMGVRAGMLSYTEILSRRMSYMGVLLSAVYVMLASYFRIFESFRALFTTLACMFIALSVFLSNQSNLDMVFIKRDKNLSTIPENIRRYNSMVMAVFIIIVMLLFNFRAVIIFGIKFLGQMVRFAAWLAYKFMQLLFPAGGAVEKRPNSSQLPLVGGYPSVIENPLNRLIFNTLACFFVLYMFYKLGPILIAAVRKLLSKLISMLKTLFNQLVPDHEFGNADYNDEVETIKPVDTGEDPSRIRKGIKDLRRNMHKITDPVERIRCFYALSVLMLKQKSIEVKPSDTTGEILGKSRQVEGIDTHFAGLTNSYDRVRYGGNIPDNDDLSTSERNYGKLVELMDKKNRKV